MLYRSTEEFVALSFDGTNHSIWKERLEKFLETHEEVVLPERVSFEASMVNVERKSKLPFVLAVFDEAFQQTLGPESKAKGYEHRIATENHTPTRDRTYRVDPAERHFIKTEVQKSVEAGMAQL